MFGKTSLKHELGSEASGVATGGILLRSWVIDKALLAGQRWATRGLYHLLGSRGDP